MGKEVTAKKGRKEKGVKGRKIEKTEMKRKGDKESGREVEAERGNIHLHRPGQKTAERPTKTANFFCQIYIFGVYPATSPITAKFNRENGPVAYWTTPNFTVVIGKYKSCKFNHFTNIEGLLRIHPLTDAGQI